MNTLRLTSSKLALLSLLALGAPLFAGCVAGTDSAPDSGDEEIGEAEQALTCSGAGCNGINPYATNCILDQVNKGTGNVMANGVKIGTVSIYYSASCQAAWAYTGLNQSHGSFTLCAFNNNTGASQCTSGGSTTYSAASPMIYLPVGQTAHAYETIQVGGGFFYATSPDFTRLY